jgi:HAD superfamily hydrolase (TIGR01509 family)
VRRDSSPTPPRPARRAVLFDFNGVLMDDERLHFLAFRDTLSPLGVRLTRRRYDARYLALDDHAACAAALRDAGMPRGSRGRATVATLVAAKRRRHAALCRARGVRVDPGAVRLVRALARRLPLAVVSSAARREVVGALRRARLERAFACIVAAEDVRRSKPHPEGYRKALRLLRMAGLLGRRTTRRCLAIEDSPGGIASARGAGLAVAGVTTSFGAAALRRAGAFVTVASLSDAPALLLRLGLQSP